MRADTQHRGRPGRLLWTTVALALAVTVVAAQEPGTEDGEWRYQSADAGGTRFSPVDQIDAGNFNDLEVAWVFRGDNFSPHEYYTFKSTPSYIDGVLYTTTNLGQVAAIDPSTGTLRWSYDPGLYLEGRPAVHGLSLIHI